MTQLDLHYLRATERKKAKRVGRGNASGRGTYSGRGLKGQRSRSGGRSGLKRRGLSQLLRNKPKLGGFKSPHAKPEVINLVTLEKFFEAGELINPKKLLSKGLVKTLKNGVKILGQDKLSKKFTVMADSFSESAKKAIIEAGGQVKIISSKK